MCILVKELSKTLMRTMDLILRKAINIYVFLHPLADSETLWIPLTDTDWIFQLCPVMAHTENVWHAEVNGRGCSRTARLQLRQVPSDQLTAEEPRSVAC